VRAVLNYLCIGIDISEKMLSLCGRSLNLIQGDALHLPFRSASFDVIYMDTPLHHITSPSHLSAIELQEKALKEAVRVLKPNGYLIVRELYYDTVITPLNIILY